MCICEVHCCLEFLRSDGAGGDLHTALVDLGLQVPVDESWEAPAEASPVSKGQILVYADLRVKKVIWAPGV